METKYRKHERKLELRRWMEESPVENHNVVAD